jgi:hypothetical protein
MNRSRTPVAILLIVSLLLTGFARQWASDLRNSGPGAVHSGGGGTGLSRMNSYALALLLGGLRGPLVMFLWPSAEEQKREKNLEDFDTKIEWIRLLQAEFDTVHLFQIWNKAYNISAQLANLANKYHAILDAIDYAHSVDQERPNDINLVSAIGQLYYEKLGNSAEKEYYREKVREQSQARLDQVRITLPADRQAQFTEIALGVGVLPRLLVFTSDPKTNAVSLNLSKPLADQIQTQFSGDGILYTPRVRVRISRDDPGWRRTEHDALLDADGNILPQYFLAHVPRPANLDPNSEWDDGSELQYLKAYQPFPYGVSTFALAYNYSKRAQVLQSVNKQRHAQLSELVIDSRPALSLKSWSEEDWEYGRRAELAAFGEQIPSERLDMELTTASLPTDARIKSMASLDEAIFDYQRAAKLTYDAIAEYQRHLRNYQTNVTNYLNHIDGLEAERELVLGDRDYLQIIKDPAQRATLSKSAIEHYHLSITRYELIEMQYYLSDDIAVRFFPKGVTRANIVKANLPPALINSIFKNAATLVRDRPDLLDDFTEYNSYVTRAQVRLKLLGD